MIGNVLLLAAVIFVIALVIGVVVMMMIEIGEPKKDLEYKRDFVGESEALVERREAAKERMKEWGRKSLLDGGEYTRRNTVLPA